MRIDETLVIAMKKGEESAFTACYQQLSSFIYSVILRICGQSAIAEEIMQESFIQVFGNLEQLEKNTHFIPWIKRIAFNKIVNHLRKDKKDVSLTDEHLDSLQVDVFDESLIQQNQLAFMLSHLTPETKLIVLLFGSVVANCCLYL
ncbi:MAG: RNA polymerase sigma factor [Alteromonadaceae bacterium]|nr:RNA polymerase sigma factor [Alteromonadaceae bacterium]